MKEVQKNHCKVHTKTQYERTKSFVKNLEGIKWNDDQKPVLLSRQTF